MPPDANQPSSSNPGWLLRRADQAGVAVLVAVGLLTTAAWFVAQGGLRGRIVELERGEPQTACFEVDVNSADWPELAQLPGIGETLAKRIVDSRRKDGPFIDHNELRRVRGIGPRTLEKLRPYLRPMPDSQGLAGR